MKLHNLSSPRGARRKRKRKARGPGSGNGLTAGRGQNGQKSRAGKKVNAYFEGGQMPIQRRIPKRGFTNIFKRTYQVINISQLANLSEGEITPEVLKEHRLIRSILKPVKLLGNGELKRSLIVKVQAVSESAKSKIEAAGGTIEILPIPKKPKKPKKIEDEK